MRNVIIYATIAFAMATAAMASECKNLCDRTWWETVTASVIEAVIENADVNARDKFGMTPLHYAAQLGVAENIVALLNAGAEVNARSEDGYMTPLHFATGQNVVVLLDAGADGSLENNKGKTPFDLTESNKKLKNTNAYWQLNDAQYK